MKEDAPPPKHPPRKRYQLENAQKVPDLWLAIWANDNELSAEEQERVRAERERRKKLKPDKIIGVLVDAENITPIQRDVIRERLTTSRPTEIHHPWASGRVVGLCRSFGVPTVAHRTLKEVVLQSMIVIVAPRGREGTPAWEAAHYARHRKLPVTMVLPDGTVKGEI